MSLRLRDLCLATLRLKISISPRDGLHIGDMSRTNESRLLHQTRPISVRRSEWQNKAAPNPCIFRPLFSLINSFSFYPTSGADTPYSFLASTQRTAIVVTSPFLSTLGASPRSFSRILLSYKTNVSGRLSLPPRTPTASPTAIKTYLTTTSQNITTMPSHHHSSLPSPRNPLIFPFSPLSTLEPEVEVQIDIPQPEARVPITTRRLSRFREEFDITWNPASPDLFPADFGFEGRTWRRSASSEEEVSPRTSPVPARARFSPMLLPRGRRPVGVYAGPINGWAWSGESPEGTTHARTREGWRAYGGACDLHGYRIYSDDTDYRHHEHADMMDCDTDSTATPSPTPFPMQEDEPTAPLPSPLLPSSTPSSPLPSSFYEWRWPRRPQSVDQCLCEQCRRQRGDPGLSSHVVNWLERQGREFVPVGQESPTLGWETGVRVVNVGREVGRRPEGEAGSSGREADEEEM